MVTRRVVRISPEEKAAATVYGSGHKNNVPQNNNNERGDEKGGLNMADDGDIDRFGGNFDVDISHCPSLPPLPPLESEAVEEESMEITRQDNDADDNNKKRPRHLVNADRGVKKKRKKLETKKSLDLTDVPEQPLIRSNRKDGTSTFKRVYFDKTHKKWRAHIMVAGELLHIGYYDHEEEAAKDYARAVFKFKNVDHPALKRKEGNGERRGRKRKNLIDLSDVPMQLPIKSGKKGSTSQYRGVSFDKANNKWEARIRIDGRQHKIGRFDDEEEAAVNHARAMFKYSGAHVLLQYYREADSEYSGQKKIDLTDVPKQLPIKSEKMGSSSQYKGVTFFKACKKWRSKIYIDGEPHVIGYYVNEEEAAIDYARAVFKYKAEKKLIDLTDVPIQLPIKREKKGTSSQYKGVFFDKRVKKWIASIRIDEKLRHIGRYDDEEKAGIDYARAVFKYKAENAKGSNNRQGKKSMGLIDVPTLPPITTV